MTGLVWHLEEPRVGQRYPNFYAAQLAAKFGKVVLGGIGGDELFGGYPWRYYRAVVNDDFEHYVDKYYDFWQRLIPNTLIRRAFHPIWSDVSAWGHATSSAKSSSARRRPAAGPRITSITRSISRPKHFSTGCSSSRTSSPWRTDSRLGFRSSTTISSISPEAAGVMKLGNLDEVVTRQRERAGQGQAFFQKTRDGKLLCGR